MPIGELIRWSYTQQHDGHCDTTARGSPAERALQLSCGASWSASSVITAAQLLLHSCPVTLIRPCQNGLLEGRIVRFFFSSRRRHTRLQGDWSSDVCSSD